MSTDRIFVVGAGGHAKVVLDALPRDRSCQVALVDDDPAKIGGLVIGHRIDSCPNTADMHDASFHVAIGAIPPRRRRHEEWMAAGGRPMSIIHSKAYVADSAVIGVGSFVAAQSVVAPDVRVGSSTIINHGAVVDHDCVLGDFAHIAPHATLGGGVEIGDDVLIGSGATILPGRRIGAGAVIAAGATIVRDVAAGDTVIFALKRKN